ncbi:MAG TPA: FAD-dependent oxidoreductase [Gammaproteobacteria bacterium]|nr:FAD-dependent oxidoreductase [Gammaproteobacteria bacterium]
MSETQSSSQPIVIIGTGLAGYTLARELRKLDRQTPLVLLSKDDGASYSKPMLSAALAQGKTPADLTLAKAASMAEQLAADIRPHTVVTGIDPAGHRVRLGEGVLEYRQLVLAVGASPIRLPLAGDAAGEVFSVNNLADYSRFRAMADPARRVAVIGAGLIGCEFANDLAAVGKEVVVIAPEATPLGRLLPPQAGAALQQGLAEAGVQWRLGATVEAVNRRADGLRLRLSDGQTLETDGVLAAVGLCPDTRLAEQAGLAVARGVAVNRELRSSDPDIFALGDCAEVAGLVLPFVMPIMHAARALAKTLAGQPTPVTYPAMPVVVKTPAHPVVVTPPPAGAPGSWQVERRPEGVRARYLGPDGALLGFALTGALVAEKQALTRELPPLLA